jgi:hypothetical protein
MAFWALVAMLWLPAVCVTILAGLWAAAAAGVWRVPPLADDSGLEAVSRAWGRPTESVRDRQAIASYLQQYSECARTQAEQVWIYDRFVRHDSLVFVGAEEQAVCAVATRGMHFAIRSH